MKVDGEARPLSPEEKLLRAIVGDKAEQLVAETPEVGNVLHRGERVIKSAQALIAFDAASRAEVVSVDRVTELARRRRRAPRG